MLRLDWDGRQVRRAEVSSTRPLAVPRVLAGRATAEAAALVPRLYSVCAHAQGSAAASAIEVARGTALRHDVREARGLASALEALQEDLRRLMIDLPLAIAQTPSAEPVARARRAIAPVLAALRPALSLDGAGHDPVRPALDDLQACLSALACDDVLGLAPERFLALHEADAWAGWARDHATPPARVLSYVLATCPGLGASGVGTMPEPTRDALAASVLAALDDDPAFDRAPRWGGEAVETGALARHADHPGLADFVRVHGNGVAARLLARLIDVASTVAGLGQGRFGGRLDAWSLREGEGVAIVHTARGLLIHRAHVAADRIAAYAIVAPTEWNFHPEGPLVRGLAGRHADDRATLERDANLVVQALDPCVACTVEIGHA